MFNHENMHNLQWTVLNFGDQDHSEFWLTVLGLSHWIILQVTGA